MRTVKGSPPTVEATREEGVQGERGERQDNKPVSVIATDSNPTQMDSVSRKYKDSSSHNYPWTPAIAECNRKMGGVDYNDQLRGYYHVRLKCRKYYKYIFWFALPHCHKLLYSLP